ncbi:MAG: CheR family methyltransferase [Xanthobacteraceae bacterium]
MAIKPRATAALPTDDILASNEAKREFAFSDADFSFLSKLAYEHSGIVLSEAKRNLAYGRLSRRLRVLKLNSFKEYRDYLAANDHEIENFINSISTNHTKFFREAHHFEHFHAHVVMPMARGPSGRLRIWSAGCSSGEEPYTIAAVLARDIPDMKRHDIRMLATDIDTEILNKAARGEFSGNSVDEVPEKYRQFFEHSEDARGNPIVVIPEPLRSIIAFRQLNLLGPWPLKGLFDVIFCRNVMIYFDGPTKTKLVDRFTEQLKPGGWLYIGHSESLIGSHPGLKLMGRTIYRREA